MTTIPLKETHLLTDILENLQEVSDFIQDEQLEKATEDLAEFIVLFGFDESCCCDMMENKDICQGCQNREATK